MSHWDRFHFEDRIIEILRDTPGGEHHFGRPFLTGYQIAIEFARRWPDDFDELGLPIGGEGIGQRTSLAQYIAGQLSQRMHAGGLSHIEGGFLSVAHLATLSFTNRGESVASSLPSAGFNPAIFRLRTLS